MSQRRAGPQSPLARESVRIRMGILGQAVRASMWLCVLPIRLHRSPLPTLLARLTPARARQPLPVNAPDLQRLMRLVVWVCHLRLFRTRVFPRACLRQSLALYYALSRIGYPVVIHFGVHKEEDLLHGHSWVTVSGTAVAEPTSLDVFHVVYSYPAASSASGSRSVEGLPEASAHTSYQAAWGGTTKK